MARPYASVGLLYCNIDTSKPGSYSIVFSVSNDASPWVSVTRTVLVVKSCYEGEEQCSDGSCATSCSAVVASGSAISSGGGSSIQTVTSNRPPPSINLAPGSVSQVYVKKGTPYVRCVQSVTSLPSSDPCEQGQCSPTLYA